MKNRVPEVKSVEDAKNYVNVVLNSDSELGKRLSVGYPAKFETIFGKVGNVRNALEYVRIPGYPVKLLSKSKLTASDVNSIPKKSVYLPNYYGIVAYVLVERVKQDKELQEMLKENDKILTSYYKNTKPILGKEVTIMIPKHENAIYINIYNDIAKLIKEDKFDDDTAVNELINNYIKEVDADLFEGAAYLK